jgi:hypothetical protein
LGTSDKALDNFIRRGARSSIGAGSQGKSRAFSFDEVERLALGMLISRDTGAGAKQAMALATRLQAAPQATIPLGALGSLKFDLAQLEAVIRLALADAVAEYVPPRRGRPRRRQPETKRGASR